MGKPQPINSKIFLSRFKLIVAESPLQKHLKMATLSLSNCNSIIHHGTKIHKIPWNPLPISLRNHLPKKKETSHCRRLRVLAVTEGSAKKSGREEEEAIPSWARPDADEPPPWARNETQKSSSEGFEVPFYVYLLASAITAIAAIGSVFEYINQKPVFGLLNSDSIFYAPVLGFFAFTGIPTSGFLWFKSVQAANKEAEEQDRRDGYR